MELGAKDYVTKPFNVHELIARIQAVLRGTHKLATELDLLRVTDSVLDQVACMVQVNGRSIDLTPSEFGILATFMASPGQVFSWLDLLGRVSGKAYDAYERTIDVHIRNLRLKLEPDAKHPLYIETVYGIGYRFAPQQAPGR